MLFCSSHLKFFCNVDIEIFDPYRLKCVSYLQRLLNYMHLLVFILIYKRYFSLAINKNNFFTNDIVCAVYIFTKTNIMSKEVIMLLNGVILKGIVHQIYCNKKNQKQSCNLLKKGIFFRFENHRA